MSAADLWSSIRCAAFPFAPALIASGWPTRIAAAARPIFEAMDARGWFDEEAEQVDPKPRTTSCDSSGGEVTMLTVQQGMTKVWQAGAADADTAVVFLHGVPGPASEWLPLLRRVGELGRAVAPDLPGFGESIASPGFRYDSNSYAESVAALLDELGVRTAHLVLHDFGGPWGLAWAAEHPDRFASVVLLNTGVWVDYRWHLAARVYRTPLLGTFALATSTYRSFAALMRLRGKRPLPEAALRSMWESMTPHVRKTILGVYKAMPDPAGEARALANRLRPLDRQALVVWGATDWGLPVGLAGRQRQAFPSATVHILPDSGHYPQLDDPDTVASLVLRFLAAQLRAGR